jgi:predicted MFS family arabinose efflux permease
VLGAFKIRSFRFQWPADLLTSWAFEMETLILGWYVLSETGSVQQLALIGSLQFLGTLLSPLVGVAGDRLGQRAVLCSMRLIYALLAIAMMAFALSGELTPGHVFAIVFLMGLVRPSDLVMRNSLIGDTMPPGSLVNAMGLARTTQDTARIAGALAGAGLLSALGIGDTYIIIACFYGGSLVLTFGVAGQRGLDPAADARSPWRDLKEGLGYVWRTPRIMAIMWLAFIVNLTAYPVTNGLLPYVAREVYMSDANGLGRLVAAYASGALLVSLLMAWTGRPRRPARFMFASILAWFGVIFIFGRIEGEVAGMVALFAIGATQGSAMVSMSVALLRTVEPRFRGRVMGVRMLVVYGLPLGLIAASVLIDSYGLAAMTSAYTLVGVVLTAFIGIKCRDAILR